MSKITIGNIEGGNNSFGDNNTITNNYVQSVETKRVLTRENYFEIINEIRELERISLGQYLDDKLLKVQSKNPDFVKILYKDIYKVLDGVDKSGDNDLLIENGDFIIEYGDIKLTGHPTNLHFALTWLHLKLVEKFLEEDPLTIQQKLYRFENDFLLIDYDTPEYSKKLKALNKQLKSERNNKDKSGWTWKDLNNIIDLKPNIAGIGININGIFSKLFDND